ncbi:phospholipase D [Lentinula edodes]|uniref:phospholipase D n=1 Tax=Lentinula edodes TaxID=5353 RepID=A0A1Q3EH49_LENED|nr:phospholipase D [Lentinula edodes]
MYYDCIVVGSGNAGSCAALSAKENGCQKVLLVDKCSPDWVGGNGYFTAGAFRTVHNGLDDLLPIVQNVTPEQAKHIDLNPYSHKDFIEDIMRLGGRRSDPGLAASVVNNSRDTVDWLAGHQVPFILSFNRQAYEVDGRQKFWGGLVLSVSDGGKGLIAAEHKALEKAGVEIWFDCPLVNLLMRDNAVSGVVVRKDGFELTIESRAVILAAGGFEASSELRIAHLGVGWEKAKVRGTPFNTGDCFAIAQGVGAKLVGDWASCHSTTWDFNAPEIGARDLTNQFTKSGYPLGVMVNGNGERFVDEGEDYRNYTYARFGKAILSQPGGYAFQVWDSKMLDILRKEEYGDGVVEKVYADTIEDLARKLAEVGLTDQVKFIETFQVYNAAVTQHKLENPDWHWDPAVKDGLSTQSSHLSLSPPKSHWAESIDKPPFMAVKRQFYLSQDLYPDCSVLARWLVVCSIKTIREGVGYLLAPCSGERQELPRPDYLLLSKLQNTNIGMAHIDVVDLVDQLKEHRQHESEIENHNEPPAPPQDSPHPSQIDLPHNHAHFRSPPTTPSMRTGPPRSLSYVYSLPNSPAGSRANSKPESGEPKLTNHEEEEGNDFPFSDSQNTPFRGALETGNGSFSSDRKGKKRESRLLEESWNPMKWFHESPKDENAPDSPFGREDGAQAIPDDDRIGPSLRRVKTEELAPSPETQKAGRVKWGRLRSLLPQVANQNPSSGPGPSAVTSSAVNITDELITGGLSTLMLRLWFEHDEKVIVCIRCKLRDFISLHTHYAVSNAYNRNVDGLPEFPRTSLPYFKFLKKEGREKGAQVGHSEFARLQREALENYLLDLIRAVMFHPASNRLCGFLEISAFSIAHAQTGGFQYKGGYLQIEAANGRSGGFGRKGASWKAKKESRWCAIRESYLVVMKEPGELEVWDVFMLDPDFTIERPKRYYRQGGCQSTPTPNICPSWDPFAVTFLRFSISGITHALGQPRTSSVSSRVATPMLDPSTHVNPLGPAEDENMGEEHPWSNNKKKKKANVHEVSKHTFFITNSQMRWKLFARNQRQMLQWITALEKAAAASHYTGSNRFESFAPIRLNVATQWLVDGRDYFWNLSRAILMAKENIYIHDWWLSPELQLRRPNKDRYRLDKLLESKAREGVKIFIILYQEVSSRTTPTDSNYSKQRLTALHPNIMVQRSPSHFQTGTFYWAHHEKLCVIDQAIAFMGGLDLCFGRWDTSQHVLIDDPDTDQSQIWPVILESPISSLLTSRKKICTIEVGFLVCPVVGQPARDLARHFVQRWNYLLRIKNHTRTMPFLLPPPEFKPGELTQMGLTGTCEMQICRSAGPWSLGTPSRIEHSIQNAYLKAIQMSEHFVYFENQFFITSTVVNDVKIENKIGDALVHRILRAHRDGTPWKCCIVIPVLPGFEFPIDHSDASAVRIILECQNRTFARGPHSIFARLRKEGIDPDDYITVFSLRNWGKLRGDVLTTEQSVLDTDMIDGTMAGKPFQVGRFAHTLRKRLMREHLGVDVDAIYEEDLMANEPRKAEHEQEAWDPESQQQYGKEEGVTKLSKAHQRTPAGALLRDGIDGFRQALHATGEAGSQEKKEILHKLGLSRDTAGKATNAALREERQMFTRDGEKVEGFPSSIVPTLEEKTVMEHRPPGAEADDKPIADKLKFTFKGRFNSSEHIQHRARSHVDDADEQERAAPRARSMIRKQLTSKLGSKWTLPTPRPKVDPQAFDDPICDVFWKDVWVASSVHNTEIFRKVFHAVPDDLVTTWKQYKEFVIHHERLNKPFRDSTTSDVVGRVPSETGDEDVPLEGKSAQADEQEDNHSRPSKEGEENEDLHLGASSSEKDPKTRKSTRGIEGFEKWERDEMEALLGELNGHLVLYPTRFLEGEDAVNNFLFNADRLLPLPIYD